MIANSLATEHVTHGRNRILHDFLLPQPSGAASVHLLDAAVDVGCPLERLCQDLGPPSPVAEAAKPWGFAAVLTSFLLRRIRFEATKSLAPEAIDDHMIICHSGFKRS